MKRKVVRHGESTMTISLPSKWIEQHRVKKGDELDVIERENNLIVGLEEKKSKKEISLDITSLEESSIKAIIANSYRLGYDKINLRFDNQKAVKTITELVEKSLLGFEIIKKDSNSCLIESITEPAKDQFDNIFSKVFLNIEELFSSIEFSLKGEKTDFDDTDRKIQQYDNFCRRIIVQRGIYENNFLQWSFHSSLIHGSRELYRLLKYIGPKKINLTKEELEILEGTKKIFSIINEAYNNKDLQELEKAHSLEKDLTYNKGYKVLSKSKNPIVIFHLMAALKHFYLSSSPLMGMLISKKD